MRETTVYKCSDTKFEKPFRIMVGGSSGSGKTTLVKNIVDGNHFSSPFFRIVYCYPSYLEEAPIEFDSIIEYRPGGIDLEYFSTLPKNSLIILDDMMSECAKSDDVMKLFLSRKILKLIITITNYKYKLYILSIVIFIYFSTLNL